MTRTIALRRRSKRGTRAKPPVPNAHPLVQEFYAMVEARGVSFCEVSLAAGYDKSVPGHWFTGRAAPTLAAFNDHLNALGFELCIWPIVGKAAAE